MPSDQSHRSAPPGRVSEADALDALRAAHALLLDEAAPTGPVAPAGPDGTTPGGGSSTPRTAGRARRDPRPWLAGAVALGVLTGGGILARAVHERAEAPRTPQVAASPARTGARVDSLAADPALPSRAGWKWVALNGVELQVPSGWGWGDDTLMPCGSDTAAAHVGIPMQAITAVGCSGTTPAADRLPVVDVLDDGTQVPWAAAQRVVAGHRVVVGWGSSRDGAATRATARQVLDSARAYGVDPNGCPAAMPGVSAGGVEQVAGATRVAVCQYQLRAGSWTPVASRRLDGAAASRLARAVTDAPQGSGPDSSAGSCSGGERGRIMMRFETPAGVRTIALHYDGCTVPNGYVAGNGVYHRLTRSNCHDVLMVPVTVQAMSAAPAVVCME